MSFIITSDTGSDITEKMCRRLDVYLICLKCRVGTETMPAVMSQRELQHFYEQMATGNEVKTSAPNIHDFTSAWEPFLKQGHDIVHISISGELSSSYQNAVAASEMLMNEYENAKIAVINSTTGSCGCYYLVEEIAKMRNAGKTVEDCLEYSNYASGRIHVLLTTGDLTYLHKGGRVSRAGMTVAHALGIMPIIGVTRSGSMASFAKVRGKGKTFAKIAEMVCDTCENPEEQTLYISHGANESDAKLLGEAIAQKCAFKNTEYNILGPIIGAHAGPGLVVAFFMGKERTAKKGEE